ncbi:MAG: helix-turn-helix transcriptional regulator [Firmicutes bacterium]|nr:helix-turn-helix transcriptional regulator [Bacillota bacterium]
MNFKKIGLFISSMRKEKSMTQKELAERLSVTDKAVSRWETGKGFPDVFILKNLSGAGCVHNRNCERRENHA